MNSTRFGRRSLWLLSLILFGLMLLHVLTPHPPTIELGPWHLLVIQSDDWGFEGWTPSLEVADSLAEARRGLPSGLSAYASSSLESAADVAAMEELLASIVDADGLPAVLQANTIVAAVSLDEAEPGSLLIEPWLPGLSLSIRPSGEGVAAYARPGLAEAVDEAIARGVWYPELHGLTHHDLRALLMARRRGDGIEARARRVGTVAYDSWLNAAELASGDAAEARAMAELSCSLFDRRFGRRPSSVIAPDYQWDRLDEEAWRQEGIRVVQGKREQIDPSMAPGTLLGRARKWWARLADRRRGALMYLDRPAELEPYGDADSAALQGADAASGRIREEWNKGRAAVLSVHRVQLSNLDPLIAAAGREQLAELLSRLTSEGAVRFCVDSELEQLRRSGLSVLDRGPWRIVRNYTGTPRRVDVGDGRWEMLRPGTHVLPRHRPPKDP